MRDEDETFADIVKQEFDEAWAPAPEAREPVRPSVPLPDFHLDLYDDDETYREVPHSSRPLSPLTWWGLALIGVGLLLTIGRMTPLDLPIWVGWVAIGCFVAGTGLCLWHLTHRGHVDEDPDGTV